MPNTGFLGWAYVTGSSVSIVTGSSKTLTSGSVVYYSGTNLLSGSDKFVYDYSAGDLFLTGNMYLSGTLNAFAMKTITVLNSEILGSNTFGNDTDDTHQFLGKALVKKHATTSTAHLEILRLEVSDEGVDMNIGHGPGLDFYVGETGGSNYGGSVAVVREVAGDADSAAAMTFHTAGDDQGPTSTLEKMRITSAGKVGIGVTDPDSLLEIFGTSTQLKLSYDATNYSTFAVGAAGALTVTTVDPDGADADLTFTLDGAFDVNANQEVAIDSTAASITVGAALASGQTLKLGQNGAVEVIIAPHDTGSNELFSITNTAGTAVGPTAAAIQLAAAAGGIGIRSAANLEGCIQIEADGGLNETISIHSDQGTGVNAKAGSTDASINLISDVGGIGLYSGINADNAITIEANGGVNETIQIRSNLGTGVATAAIANQVNASIALVSDVGGIALASGLNADGSIFLEADAGANETIVIHSNQGTGEGTSNASIQLLSDAGGIDLTATTLTGIMTDTNSDAAVQLSALAGGIGIRTTSNLAGAIQIEADGGASETIIIRADQGTGADSIQITSDGGGIALSAGGLIKTTGAGVEIENGSATGAAALLIDNNDTNQIALSIEAANLDANIIDINADALTTGTAIYVSADNSSDWGSPGSSPYNGSMLWLHSDSSDTEQRTLASIKNDNTAAVNTGLLVLWNDAAHNGPNMTIADSANDTDAPSLSLTNFGANNKGSVLQFSKDPNTLQSGVDNAGDDDFIGSIHFTGHDYGGTSTTYAKIDVQSSDVTNTDEGGKMSFSVIASADGGSATAASVGLLTLGGMDQANSDACVVEVNPDAIDCDFIVNSDLETRMLFVDAGSNRVSIGDSTDAPAATLEVTNHASAGAFDVPLLQLNSNDLDQVAVDINAANTTANVIDIAADAVTTAKVIDITADGLTTGNALYIDDASTNTGTRNTVEIIQNAGAAIAATALQVQSDGGITGINLDKNFEGTTAATVTGLQIDFDKTGASTSNNTMYGLNIDMDNATATNGANTMYGLHVTPTLTHAANAGLPVVYGALINAQGGTNGTAIVQAARFEAGGGDLNYGIQLDVEDGGVDLRIESSADSGDYFQIATTTHGATTISTVDDDSNDDADLTFDVDGKLVFEAKASDEAVFNESGLDVDFRVESVDDTHMIFVEGSSNRVSIGVDTDGPAAVLEVAGDSAAASPTLTVTHAEDTNNAVDIVANAVTTANVLDIQANAVTSGNAVVVANTGNGTGNGAMIKIEDADHASGARIGLDIDFDTDVNSDAVALRIDSEQQDGMVVQLDCDEVTTGQGIYMTADKLTTGNMIKLESNSSTTGTRQLVLIQNDHASATDALPLYVVQDAVQSGQQGTACAVFNTTVASQTAATVKIWNSNADQYGPVLELSNKTQSPADGTDDDYLGQVTFVGFDDGTPTSTTFASINAQATDVTAAAKNGTMYFNIMAANASAEVARLNPESPTTDTFMGGFGTKKPVFNLDGANNFTATHSMSGLTILTTSADAKTITLPADAAAAIGFNIKIIIGTTMTGTLTITSAASGDLWFGGVQIVSTTVGNADTFGVNGSDHYQIVADGDTKGRHKGGWVELTLIAANKWAVCGTLAAAGTPGTPFA